MNEFYVYLLGIKYSREIPNNMTCLDVLQVSQDPSQDAFRTRLTSKTSGHLFFRDSII